MDLILGAQFRFTPENEKVDCTEIVRLGYINSRILFELSLAKIQTNYTTCQKVIEIMSLTLIENRQGVFS